MISQRALQLVNLLLAVLAAGGLPAGPIAQILKTVQTLTDLLAGLPSPVDLEAAIADAHQLVDALVANGILKPTIPEVVALQKFAAFEHDVTSGQVGIVGTTTLKDEQGNAIKVCLAAFRYDSAFGKELGLS